MLPLVARQELEMFKSYGIATLSWPVIASLVSLAVSILNLLQDSTDADTSRSSKMSLV
jgi:hypothetical protein